MAGRPFLGGAAARSPPQHQLTRPTGMATRPVQRHRLQVSAGLQDPWSTLGVPRSASEKEVKKAHRQLVKQHHPDVRSQDPMAGARFIRIQEAYELIMGKRSGKEIDGVPASKSSWAFHDWYWSFSTKRRAQARGKAFAGAAADAEGPAPADQWRAQVAGLRQKAAAKRARGPRRAAYAADAPPASAAEARQQRGGDAGGSSMAAAAAAGQAEPASRQQVHATAAEAAQPLRPAASEGAPRKHSQADPAHSNPGFASAAAASAHHAAHADAGSHAEAPHSAGGSSHEAGEQHGTSRPTGGFFAASHSRRLQLLLEHAATLVQGVQRGAEGAAAAHSHGVSEHARHLRSRLSLDHLSSLLGMHRAARHADTHAVHAAGNAVPAGVHLHHHFEATRQHRLHRQPQPGSPHAAAEQGAAGDHTDVSTQVHATGGGAGTAGGQLEHHAQPEPQQHTGPSPYSSAGARHARKFANREKVEQRLSGQLAGLKRRAAVKHEVEAR